MLSENPVSENEHYILMYYQSGVHTWNSKVSYFKYTNGVYTLGYTTTSVDNIKRTFRSSYTEN
ncbi:MAG: hypothetical protein IJT79_08875 [Ruminococcus sp.]|nr:hypothetical protein [Ruminococcus sp.]